MRTNEKLHKSQFCRVIGCNNEVNQSSHTIQLGKDTKNLPYVYPFKIFTPKQAEYLKDKKRKKERMRNFEGASQELI